MLPRNRTRKSANFSILNSLFTLPVSPLPRSPGYLVNCPASYPESNRAGYSPRYPVRNPAGYLGGYPASYRAGYLAENLVSYPAGYPDSNSASSPADCPDNRLERNPESSRESNGADYSESYWADSLPNCLAGYRESFDSRPVCRAAAGTKLVQLDDLADSLGLSLRLGHPHKVHSRCQRPHIIRAGMKVQHLPAAAVEQRGFGDSPRAGTVP
jgi:hypothetical protein